MTTRTASVKGVPEEPTRDEIREACEAVGWPWNGRRVPAGEELRLMDFDHAVVPGYGAAFHPSLPSRLTADVFALLEATGEDYEIQRHRSGFSVGFIAADWLEHAPNLPAAAVRAVNARAKTVDGIKR